MPKISVIVPVYNVEKYLNRCVDSILAQTFTDFELILVDDGSPDNCPQICDDYAQKDNRIKVFHKANGGVSSARNLGLSNARGEYIMFCDSDDYWEPDCMQTLLENAEESGVNCVVMNYKVVDDEGVRKLPINYPEIEFFTDINSRFQFTVDKLLARKKTGCTWEIWVRIFKKCVIDKFNIRFCETCENFAEDLAFTLEYTFCSDSVKVIDYAGYCYCRRSGSMMDTSENKVKLNALNEVSKHFYNFLMKRYDKLSVEKIYPYIHFLIMINQLSKVISLNMQKQAYQLAKSIEDYDWYSVNMKKTLKSRKARKIIRDKYGKQMAFEYLNLCRLTLHGSYKRYSYASAVFYKFLCR